MVSSDDRGRRKGFFNERGRLEKLWSCVKIEKDWWKGGNFKVAGMVKKDDNKI